MKRVVKTLLRLLMLSILGWLTLSACSPSAAPPTSAPPTRAPQTPTGVESSTPGATATFDGLYPPQDLSLVANTGRPQLLNSYANW